MASRKVLSQLGKAFGRTAARRLTRGPKRPSWSFRYEWLVELLRIQFGEDPPPTLQIMRKVMDATGDREDRRRRSHTEWTEVAGMDAAWVTPLWRETSGTVLYLHGGGYVVGSPRSHRGIMASVACTAGVRVLGVDYRLPPEHPCPAAIEDAVRAYRWLIEDAHVDPRTLLVAGDSAGGGLTAATLVALRDEGLPLPAGAVLFSPWLDLTGETALQADTRFDFIFPNEGTEWAGAYAAKLGRTDPRCSPLFADLHDLPPMLVLAGELEVLVEESRRFAAKARAAGADVRLHVEPDEIHVYPAFFDVSPRAQAALGRVAQFVQDCFADAELHESARHAAE